VANKTKRREDRYRHSSFALDSALKAYNDSYALLSDGNNYRATWITSARVLERANSIAKQITEPVHINVLEAQREQYRKVFGDLLGFDNYNKGGSFFYGTEKPESSIDEAAPESTKRKDISTEAVPGASVSVLKAIPESVLRSLWDFASFPSEYEDPIRGEFTEEEVTKTTNWFLWPGLFQYLKHTRTYQSIGGKLIKISDDGVNPELHTNNR
jgi:hypothetical protein